MRIYLVEYKNVIFYIDLFQKFIRVYKGSWSGKNDVIKDLPDGLKWENLEAILKKERKEGSHRIKPGEDSELYKLTDGFFKAYEELKKVQIN